MEVLTEAGFALTKRFHMRDGIPLPGVWYGIFGRLDALRAAPRTEEER